MNIKKYSSMTLLLCTFFIQDVVAENNKEEADTEVNNKSDANSSSSDLMLTGDEPIDDLTDLSNRPYKIVHGKTFSNDPTKPLNQLLLERSHDGWIKWQSTSGHIYSLDPSSVRPGRWGIVRDITSMPIMGYYQDSRNRFDSIIVISVDGLNSRNVSLFNLSKIPNKLHYLGVDDGTAFYNPLKRPAVYVRAVGYSNKPPLDFGESLSIVSVSANLQDQYVDTQISIVKNEITNAIALTNSLANRAQSFVNNLRVQTFKVMRGEHAQFAHPNWLFVGCGDPDAYARSQCPNGFLTRTDVYGRRGNQCGYGYYVYTCTYKPY
ncbi:MAG: hypothetical protein JAY85_06035 [Candidatus Thiodiazotropha weberae]|uniref:hypothetical protein n=1 Tax=Candidatus Thiodiazotropha endoloripes TaxID=1818881 RepID=UPI00114D038F|nr:hypothetical protein [Candidatus Thiodiazotropha endoloripes]MCG7898000.1 hypothetical protein [Candidatus Thiodiazotropha weberae]